MKYLKLTQTCYHIITALVISTMLVACGGSGSSATPGVTSLLITLTAPSASNNNATGVMSTNSQGAWQGGFNVGTSSTLFSDLTSTANTISSATIASSGSPTSAIINLTVGGGGFTFDTSGTITQNQYNALKAAGTNLIVRVVDSANNIYTVALTQS